MIDSLEKIHDPGLHWYGGHYIQVIRVTFTQGRNPGVEYWLEALAMRPAETHNQSI